MPTIDTTAVAASLKQVYGNRITDLFARHKMTYNQFLKTGRKPSYRPGGSGYYFSTRQGDIESIGGRAEGEYLPEPLAGDGIQGYVTPRLIYGSMRLSGLALEVGKSNMEAFVSIQGDQVKNLFNALVNDLNRQCWGDGYGLLGVTSAAATPNATATWDATFDNDRGVRYMKKGMIVDFFDSTGATQNTTASSLRIDSINPITKVVTFETISDTTQYRDYHPTSAGRGYTNTTASIPAAGIMVRQGARAAAHTTSTASREIIGINGMFDDGTLLGTYEGLTTTTAPEFIANIMDNSAINRELSIDLMLAAMDMTAARSGREATIIRTGLGQRRKYFNLLANDVRYAPAKFIGGYESIGFSQNQAVTMVFDPVTQPNRMYFEPPGVIRKYELTPIGWGGFDPNKMHWRQDYDEATMFLRTYTNLGVEERNALTLLDDLNEPSNQPF